MTLNTQAIPLYAEMPRLFSAEAMKEIETACGLTFVRQDQNLIAELIDAVRTYATTRPGSSSKPPIKSRDWALRVASAAEALRTLLMDRKVLGWSVGVESDQLPRSDIDVDRVISDLPESLEILALAAMGLSQAKGEDGGRPRNFAQNWFFGELGQIFIRMTNEPLRVREKWGARDRAAPAVKWVVEVMRHSAECFAEAGEDTFGSKYHAQDFSEIAELSPNTLVDLIERAARSRASSSGPIRFSVITPFT
jgi:hypothetical protein